MYKHFFKHLFDYLFALILIILLSPLFIIVSIIIKIDSKGPAIFKQVRSGKDNKNFTIYKFRTMRQDNDLFDKSKDDQNTKIGYILRKTSIDELPQLFNVLKGEMSFIGPRPWVTEYAKYFTKTQMHRLDVLPGITGYAQVCGRNGLDVFKKIEADIYYADHLTFFMDLKVLYLTFVTIFSKKGYSNNKQGIHNEIEDLKKQHEKKKSNSKPKAKFNKKK